MKITAFECEYRSQKTSCNTHNFIAKVYYNYHQP